MDAPRHADHTHAVTVKSLLLPLDIDARRRAANQAPTPQSIAALTDSLARELEPLLTRSLPIPERKARMTRGGGRCPVHGVLLEFDPYSPQSHQCARCNAAYRGLPHDDWWAMNAQLWTVERAVHAAALFALRGRDAHASLATNILRALAERYQSWPNADNVLGPSRPFFSTYLESIWLLNVCQALSLLERAGAPGVAALGTFVRDRLIAPSAKLIMSFPEGSSNRQVWNEVAALNANVLLNDRYDVGEGLSRDGGLFWLMQHSLLPDGTWYEGENYHLFAHRGLWYGVQLAMAHHVPLPHEAATRYQAGFVSAFASVLPDDTLPSRRDSQYAISLRQWRIAEWLELGYAHTPDARIAGVLTRMYDDRGARGDTGRWNSTADAERNRPAARLTRADLSWRALLMASVEMPPNVAWLPSTALLPAQGLSVFRRDAGRTYVALEGGHTGGGHGHPDALSLTLQADDARWLDDPGTGSYTDRSLHWYRSTLAHAAPLFDRASQHKVPVELLAFAEHDGVGWTCKRARNVTDGVTVERAVIVMAQYLVDVLEWHADRERELTLPIMADADVLTDGAWHAVVQNGAGGLEDGFDHLSMPESIPMPSLVRARAMSQPVGHGGARHADVWYASSGAGALVRASVLGPPGHGATRRHWIQVRGQEGRVVGVWSWNADRDVERVGIVIEPHVSVSVALRDGAVHSHRVWCPPTSEPTHRNLPDGWQIDCDDRGRRTQVHLGPLAEPLVPHEHALSAIPVARSATHATAPRVGPTAIVTVSDAALGVAPGEPIVGSLSFTLGEPHYVQTEQPWVDAGRPTACVQLAATDEHFVADVLAITGAPVVPPRGARNALDNERAEINGDGLQWYLGRNALEGWASAGLVVAAVPDAARTIFFVADSANTVDVQWRRTLTGWALRLRWPRHRITVDESGTFVFDLIVNERPSYRERRRGQLVLSGGRGFGYLRGDRHEPSRGLRLTLPVANTRGR